MSDLCCEYTNGISGHNQQYMTRLVRLGSDQGKLYHSGHGRSASDLGENILLAYGDYELPSFDLELLRECFKNIHQSVGRKK